MGKLIGLLYRLLEILLAKHVEPVAAGLDKKAQDLEKGAHHIAGQVRAVKDTLAAMRGGSESEKAADAYQVSKELLRCMLDAITSGW